MRALAPLLAFAACAAPIADDAGAGPDGEDGGAVADPSVDAGVFGAGFAAPFVCLGTTAAWTSDQAGTDRAEVEGVVDAVRAVNAVFDVGPCRFGVAPAQVLALVDDAGETWWLGVGLLQDGVDVAPPFDFADGSTRRFVVDLNLDAWVGDRAVQVRDGGGALVLALEELTGLVLGGASDLAVTPSAFVGPVDEAMCGPRRGRMQSFAADTTILVAPGGTADILVDGRRMIARNAGAWAPVGAWGCTDGVSPSPWLVHRAP